MTEDEMRAPRGNGIARLSITNLGVIVALFISIGNGVWNAAILSDQVQHSNERITALEKEVITQRDRREAVIQELATIEVKLDLLLKERDRRP